MKRSTILTYFLGAALVLIPVFELYAQQRRSRYGGQNNSTQQGDNRGSRDSRFSGYGGYQRQESNSNGVELPLPGKPLPTDFEILIQKSIFDKDRRARSTSEENRTAATDSRPAPVVVRPPGIPILIGVILGDDDYIAYIEDPDTSKLWPFAAGDTLPGNYGTVRQVYIDGIEIARDGLASPQRILIGENLKGEIAELPPLPDSSISSTPASKSSSSSSSASAVPAATLPAGLGDMTIEQRMKLRRLQQVGQ